MTKTADNASMVYLEHNVAREEWRKIQDYFWKAFQMAIFVNGVLATFSIFLIITDLGFIMSKNAATGIFFMGPLFFGILGILTIKYLFNPLIEDQILSLSYWKDRIRRIEAMSNFDILNSAFLSNIDSLRAKTDLWRRFQFGVTMFWTTLIAGAYFVILMAS